MKDRAVVEFYYDRNRRPDDLDIPLDITANELVEGLNQAYNLGIDMDDISSSYFSCMNPICLLKGNQTLRDYGIRNGSQIYYGEKMHE